MPIKFRLSGLLLLQIRYGDVGCRTSYPILEHDPACEALIEPSKIIKPRDVPKHCVICFFGEVIEKVVAEHNAKILARNKWEDG